MRKVYTIVLYEKSASEFHDPDLNGNYFHHGKTVFSSGTKEEAVANIVKQCEKTEIEAISLVEKYW